MASQIVRVLLVEDSDEDATLISESLRRAGFDLVAARVDTARAFEAKLDEHVWDVIISDHMMPQFSPVAALEILHARALDLPFIVVSGTIDEEKAVSILKAGAHDFVTKQRLARLGPAVSRELAEATNRAARRAAEREVRVQRDFLRLVIDADPSLIFVKDWNGRFVLANRALADLHATSPDAILGQTSADFNPELDAGERSLRHDQGVIEDRRSELILEEPMTDARTGDVRWFEIRKLPLVGSDGAARQLLGIGREITARKRAEHARDEAESQLRHAQKMEAIGLLAGGIAHDFNNVLTAILGYSELLLERLKDTPDVVADLEEIKKAGERAASLTRQLLAFSRKQLLQPEVIDLNEVIGDVERMLRRIIGEHVRLQTAATPEPARINADRSQIEQVLVNVAVNARDAMPQGGTLTIRTEFVAPSTHVLPVSDVKRWISLSITDTGSGMPPDVSARIFEPFFTTKGPGKGTGLGLSTVHGIVTQSGGHITVDTEPDKGTTFTIYLPEVQGVIQPRELALAPAAVTGDETILVVEDDAAIRELIRKALVARGYTVLEASDGVEGVARAAAFSGPIHLLLTDVVMPKLSGPDAAQHIVGSRPGMHVLYISGFASTLAINFGTLGANASFLHKPFTADHLVKSVRTCLDRTKLPGRRAATSRASGHDQREPLHD